MYRLKASFTVEAAVIVPLAMFIMTAFIYSAFYAHDRVVLGCSGAEYALENAAGYEDSISQIQEETEELLEKRLILLSDVSVDVETDDGITVSCSAQFKLPMAFLADLTGMSSGQVSTSLNISVTDARKTLLKYQALAGQ